MKSLAVSIGKDPNYNEDSVIVKSNMIAVSDGAGGGGLFADKWSSYLLSKLPETPIRNYLELENWIDSIWEEFYNEYEEIAKALGGVELDKFYNEGSLATLVVIWFYDNYIHWLTYGDSTFFMYDFEAKKLSSNIKSLLEYNNPPYLINCNEPLEKDGVSVGEVEKRNNCVYFCASDALSHYILSSYMISRQEEFGEHLTSAISSKSKNSNFINAILQSDTLDFEKDVIIKLLNCSKNRGNFKKHVLKLQREGKIAVDDYSICFMYDDKKKG